ncbi:MAG: hypothetical protein AAFY05_18785 [Pseudomonadota bacterium]
MSRFAKGFAAVYFLICSAIVLFASLVPSGTGPVAVFAKPWGKSAIEVVAAAEAPVIFVRNGSWIALTESTDQELVSRLYEAGAGFVASSAVAMACARLSGLSLEKNS